MLARFSISSAATLRRTLLSRPAVLSLLREKVLAASAGQDVSTPSHPHPRRFQSTYAATSIPTHLPTAPPMVCRQCEQTADHKACVTVGVCGKTAETATLQDVLMNLVQHAAQHEVASSAQPNSQTDWTALHEWVLSASFSTLTNVNFSSDRIAAYIREGSTLLHEVYGAKDTPDYRKASLEDLENVGLTLGLAERAATTDPDVLALQECIVYGLKGTCAYAMHAWQLGFQNEAILQDIQALFAKSVTEQDVAQLTQAALDVGEVNARVLALLDEAHASNFGSPTPTPVRRTAVQGKAILVSGHDLGDLEALLEQTAGTGINVYTHGEMLPAHAYPKLKAHDHLVGNYGSAWQAQKYEFAGFPGPIVVTTNCIVAPRRNYKDRLFTMNQVGMDGVQHVENRDFSAVIQSALECKGFERTVEPADYHTVGFNHRAVLPLADKVLEAAKSGQLSRIFLIGGCDGSQWDRSYFTDLAEEAPDDSLILTLGCAKNRLIHSEKLQHATLQNGLPRLLDMGQCNDAYSAVVVATELAKALDCGINDLPLSLAISHLEQKAAAVLLTLLHLGVKNIRLGPSLPAYLSPNVLALLQKDYNLMATGNAQDDMAAMLKGE